MSNFTKSIVYSGVVLAAGLVAIIAIYNNMAQDGANYANMEPAAGEAAGGFTETYDDVSTSIENAAGEAAVATEAAVEDTTEAVQDAVEGVTETDAVVTPESAVDAEAAADAEVDATTTETPAEETPAAE